MDNKLKPYESYRETENDWLGNIPSHWKETSIRGITKLSIKRNRERTDLELLSVYREYGVIKKKSRNDNHNVESEDLSNYKYVDRGYLVLNKMKMWQGSLGVSKYEGIVSPAYIVCKLNNELNTNYINYLLRAAVYKTIYNRLSYGVRVGQWDMRYDDFKSVKVYIPPKEEQDQIVRYLDWKLSKINKFIRAKKKQLGLLIEQKQAIINIAVTKGIDANRALKNSGVDWLGYIDSSSTLQRLKDAFVWHAGGAWGSDSQGDRNDRICIRVADFSYDTFNLRINEDMTIRNYSQATINKLELEKGMILIEKSGGGEKSPVGRAILFDADIDALYANFIEGFRVCEEYSAKYVVYWLANMYAKGVSRKNLKFTTGIQNLDIKLYLSEPIIKRTLQEQDLIVGYLDKRLRIIESLKNKLHKEIDLITEYRINLISDVVTGKVDVRDIVVDDILDVVDETEAAEEIDELDEPIEEMEG